MDISKYLNNDLLIMIVKSLFSSSFHPIPHCFHP